MGKKYDIVAVVGEYTNRQGETKKQYKNVGAIMTNDKGFYMMLDRTFNPAGVPNPDNRSACILSLFEPRDKTEPVQSAQPVTEDFDDIPF